MLYWKKYTDLNLSTWFQCQETQENLFFLLFNICYKTWTVAGQITKQKQKNMGVGPMNQELRETPPRGPADRFREQVFSVGSSGVFSNKQNRKRQHVKPGTGKQTRKFWNSTIWFHDFPIYTMVEFWMPFECRRCGCLSIHEQQLGSIHFFVSDLEAFCSCRNYINYLYCKGTQNKGFIYGFIWLFVFPSGTEGPLRISHVALFLLRHLVPFGAFHDTLPPTKLAARKAGQLDQQPDWKRLEKQSQGLNGNPGDLKMMPWWIWENWEKTCGSKMLK